VVACWTRWHKRAGSKVFHALSSKACGESAMKVMEPAQVKRSLWQAREQIERRQLPPLLPAAQTSASVRRAFCPPAGGGRRRVK